MTATVHTADVVLTMSTDGPPGVIRDGAVLVVGDRVEQVAHRSEVTGDRVREWRGVLTPGLVNAHAHLEYGPPFAHLATAGLSFPQWIAQLGGIRRGLSDVDWQVAARGSAHQLLRSGTTCVADVVTHGSAVAVAGSLGLQGTSYVELAGVDDDLWPEASSRLASLLALRGRPVGVSPHTVYSLSSAVFRDMVELARTRGLRLHPHLAETADEAEWVLSGTGAFVELMEAVGLRMDLQGRGAGVSAVRHCDDLGGLGPDVHVAHGVHVDAADRALLRARQTAVALCTRSNAVLGAGEAPVAAYLAEGNLVALGTDSLASSPDLDLLAEARAARDLAVRQGFAHPEELLVRAMTTGGAQALGLDVGTIRAGGRADLAVFDVPTDGDPYEAMVEHGASRCVATVLGGRLVHRR